MATSGQIFSGEQIRGLFVTDLDGTLLTDDGDISATDLRTLSCMQKKGILTAIATGRSDYSFNVLLDSLGFAGDRSSFPVDFVIFSTGAGILKYPEQKLLESFSLGRKDVSSITKYLCSYNLDFMVHLPVPDTRYFLYSSHVHENTDFQARLKKYNDFARPFSRSALLTINGATEVLCIVPKKNAHEIAAVIAEHFQQFSVIKATSPLDGESIWIEIFAPTVSKSLAVQWLIAYLGSAKENVCAIGNDYNDEDLLCFAGHGFVVANSPSPLLNGYKKVASNNENGVSEAARRWLETYNG